MNKGLSNLFALSLALLAFAGNSVLCRLALEGNAIDAQSFTMVRLLSGAVMLWFLLRLEARPVAKGATETHWPMAILLLVYAAAFSNAYLQLGTGEGALVLFGSVQFTLVVLALIDGEQLSSAKVAGLICALTGLAILVLPSLSIDADTASYTGFVLMAISGIAWGGYTFLGRRVKHPLMATASNFRGASLIALPAYAVFLIIEPIAASPQGWIFAIVSGAITSGLGYAIWYRTVPSLSSIQSGVLQFLVPPLAALGGTVFLGEAVPTTFYWSSSAILLGILLVSRRSTPKPLARE